MKHHAVLTGGKSTEMEDRGVGRHANRQHQAIPGLGGGFPPLGQKSWEKKAGRIPRRLRVLGKLPSWGPQYKGARQRLCCQNWGRRWEADLRNKTEAHL